MDINWLQLKKIANTALDLQTEDREAFLDQACGNDPELRAAAAALMTDDGIPEEFMKPPIRGAATQVATRFLDQGTMPPTEDRG